MKKNNITELLAYPNGKIEPIPIDMYNILKENSLLTCLFRKLLKHIFFSYDHMERILNELFRRHDGIQVQVISYQG